MITILTNNTFTTGAPSARGSPVSPDGHCAEARAYARFWRDVPGPQLLQALKASKNGNCSLVKSWQSGGCRVAAEALLAWVQASGRDPVYAPELWVVATDESYADHVMVRLCSPVGTDLFLSADMVMTRQVLYAWLALEFPYDTYTLVPWCEVPQEKVAIPYDPGIVALLAAQLCQYLGEFSPRVLGVGEVEVA
jgi:hypothetical protein